ncbi:MAG: peroxidase [Gemmatimonadota bacterium]
MVGDAGSASLAPVDQAILHYTRKLTLTPGAMSADDVDRLREHGLDDRAIHDLCSIISYFAFVNRIADGLGVEVES